MKWLAPGEDRDILQVVQSLWVSPHLVGGPGSMLRRGGRWRDWRIVPVRVIEWLAQATISKEHLHEQVPFQKGEMTMKHISTFKRLRGAALSLAAGTAVAAFGFGTQAVVAADGPIVVFMPPGTDNYLAQWQVGAKTKAKELGYEIKIIESSRDQAEQDAQVQQQLASGEDVAGFIWWPYVNAAGTGSLRALSQTGKPVIFTNQYPIEGTEAFWTAYAGVDDFLNGKTAAEMLLEPAKRPPRSIATRG